VTKAKRTRLDPDRRREHLLAAGAKLFASHTYDDVWVEGVAREAGVSRGLLYHYFGSKRKFFEAILRTEGERLAAITAPDPTLPPLDRLRAGVDSYLDYVEEHPESYRAVHRGAVSADPQLRAVVAASLDRQAERLLDSIRPSGPPNPTERLAAHGWLAFLVAATLRWLDDQSPSRIDVRDLCVDALLGAIAAAQGSDSGERAPTAGAAPSSHREPPPP
jgi:AcrR family transcriptional regulator